MSGVELRGEEIESSPLYSAISSKKKREALLRRSLFISQLRLKPCLESIFSTYESRVVVELLDVVVHTNETE